MLSYLDIEKIADEFLRQHHPSLDIPIPIEDIAEYGLSLDIVTEKGLFANEYIDAYITADLTELHIDQDQYMDKSNRGRFTIAHEVGHYVMHQEHIHVSQSVEAWKQNILGESSGRDYLETEADSFAGCVLMPRAKIMTEFEARKNEAAAYFAANKMTMPKDEALIPFVANKIGLKFEVSSTSVQFRLERILKNPIKTSR